MWEQKTWFAGFNPLMDEFRSLSLFLVGWILMHSNESRSFRWMSHGWFFPSIVRCQSTAYLCAGEDDSVARERNARRTRERERSVGLLLQPRILDPNFLHGLQPARMQNRNRVVSILYCRFLFLSFLKNILSIMYFGHLASSPNCAIL
jgi:hypothetical protein